MDKESTDSAVHLSDIENIANGLEKLVTSWEIEGAHRSVKYSSLHTDQLYNDEHKRKTGQMQLSIQSSQAMPSINSSGLQKSVIKGRFQYNPSTSFSQVRWKAELEGCNQLSFKLKDHQSNSSAEDSREIQQDLNVQLEDNASSTSRMSTVSNVNNYCQSGSQALNKLENQENYQIYKEAKAQGTKLFLRCISTCERKSHQEQLHAEKEQSMLTPKTKDAKSEKVEQTFMREEIHLDNCRKRIHKLEMERDALVKECLNYIKRERQFESQKKILADAMCKVNSLQRKLSKKEEENIECLLREKEIKAQLYEIQVSLQESRAASSGSGHYLRRIVGMEQCFCALQE